MSNIAEPPLKTGEVYIYVAAGIAGLILVIILIWLPSTKRSDEEGPHIVTEQHRPPVLRPVYKQEWSGPVPISKMDHFETHANPTVWLEIRATVVDDQTGEKTTKVYTDPPESLSLTEQENWKKEQAKIGLDLSRLKADFLEFRISPRFHSQINETLVTVTFK